MAFIVHMFVPWHYISGQSLRAISPQWKNCPTDIAGVPWHYISGQSLHNENDVISFNFSTVPWHYISGQSLHHCKMLLRALWIPWHYISGQSLHNRRTGRDRKLECTMTLHFRAISPLSGGSSQMYWNKYHDITFPGNLSTNFQMFMVFEKNVPWHYISGQSLHHYVKAKKVMDEYHDITFPGNLSTKHGYTPEIFSVPWHYISGQSLHWLDSFLRLCSWRTMTLHFRAISPQIKETFVMKKSTMTLHFRAISPLDWEP